MDILIRDIEMPKEPDEFIEIAIFGDGKVIQTGESWRNLENGKCYYTSTTPEKFFNAVPTPSHGDLIDRDKLAISTSVSLDGKPYQYVHIDNIKSAPIVIPKEED